MKLLALLLFGALAGTHAFAAPMCSGRHTAVGAASRASITVMAAKAPTKRVVKKAVKKPAKKVEAKKAPVKKAAPKPKPAPKPVAKAAPKKKVDLKTAAKQAAAKRAKYVEVRDNWLQKQLNRGAKQAPETKKLAFDRFFGIDSSELKRRKKSGRYVF